MPFIVIKLTFCLFFSQVSVYHKPFQGDLVQESVAVAFFGTANASTRFSQIFYSSSLELPNELEIPHYMVAVASTAVRIQV